MNKPDNTPVAVIISIIVLGLLVIGCICGGLGLVFFGWTVQSPPPVEIQGIELEGDTVLDPGDEASDR